MNFKWMLHLGKGTWQWHPWPFAEVISALATTAEATKIVSKMRGTIK